MMQVSNQDVLDHLSNYVAARIDLKNLGVESNVVKIISSTDSELGIFHENWFKDQHGEGLIIENTKIQLDLKIQCINDGELTINLESKDIKDISNRFPIYVDFNKFIVKNMSLINNHTNITPDTHYVFKKIVKYFEIIDIHLEGAPFNSSSEFTNFKIDTNKYSDSYNILFNILFIGVLKKVNDKFN